MKGLMKASVAGVTVALSVLLGVAAARAGGGDYSLAVLGSSPSVPGVAWYEVTVKGGHATQVGAFDSTGRVLAQASRPATGSKTAWCRLLAEASHRCDACIDVIENKECP
jgi:hypothetical protein